MKSLWFFAILCAIVHSLPVMGQSERSELRKSFSIIPLPSISYHPQTKWAFGANATMFARFDTLSPTSMVFAEYKYSQLKQSLADLRWSLMLKGDQLRISGGISYRYFPDVFFGIGPKNQEGDLEYYTYRSWEAGLRVAKKVSKNQLLGAGVQHFQYSIPVYDANGILEQSTDIVGNKGGVCNSMGAFWAFDTREHAISPKSGWLIQAEAFPCVRGVLSDFSFLSAKLDVRKYLKITDRQVVGIQLLGHYLFGEAPFRIYPRIATGNGFRGYPGGRFTDKGMVMAQIEYRVLLVNTPHKWPAFGINVFVSGGDVFHNLKHFQLGKIAAGLGLRVILDKKNRALVRFEQGFSRLSSENYVEGGEAF